jgi:hypothetical protein
MNESKRCQICGKDDLPIAGVAASGLAPTSHAICEICLAMNAEPLGLCDAILEKTPGAYDSVTYDPARDFYMSWQTGDHIPIIFLNGARYETRTEFVSARS